MSRRLVFVSLEESRHVQRQAGQDGSHKPKAISGEYRVWLLQRIKGVDFALRGLVNELAERGLKVDYRSVWAFVHAEKLSEALERSAAGSGRHSWMRRGAASMSSALPAARRASTPGDRWGVPRWNSPLCFPRFSKRSSAGRNARRN
jgi:hypothetical protein